MKIWTVMALRAGLLGSRMGFAKGTTLLLLVCGLTACDLKGELLENKAKDCTEGCTTENIDLKGLTISPGLLSPGFEPHVTSYTAKVASSVQAVTITAVSNGKGGHIYVNDVEVESGQPSGPIALNVGDNSIRVLVVAGNSHVSKTYTIVVNRAPYLPSQWMDQAYLKAPNAPTTYEFGDSVALDQDTLAVGTANEQSNTTAIINGDDLSSTNNLGAHNGAVYVFRRTGTDWSHEAYLKAPNTTDWDRFGKSVALDQDTIAVGAHDEDSNTTAIVNGSNLSSANDLGDGNGAVYIFKRTGVTWVHEAYLKAPNTTNWDAFGLSVALSQDTIAVGSPNEDSNTTTIINDGDLSSTNDLISNSGAVYVFKRSGATWSHEAYLKGPNTGSGDVFGTSISLDQNTIAVGAYSEDSNTTAIINGNDLSSANDLGLLNGAVYVFRRIGTTWSHEAYLKAPNTTNGDRFGSAIALEQDTIAVGAHWEGSNTSAVINGNDLSSTNDLGDRNGAVYVYKRTGNTWSHEAYLKAANTTNSDFFGMSVALDQNTIAVGVFSEASNTAAIINGNDLSSTNDLGLQNGAVYVYKRTGATWAPEAYLKASNTTDVDWFGWSVTVDQGTIAVGAMQEDSNTTAIINGGDLSSTNDLGTQHGAVYVFRSY